MHDMLWKFCLILSIVVFVILSVLIIVSYLKRRKTRRMLSVLALFIAVTFICAGILLFPLIYENRDLFASSVRGFAALFQTIRSSLQVFNLNADYIELFSGASGLSRGWAEVYQVYAAILYVIAPLLLIGLVVSLFQNAFVRVRLRFTKNKDFYVFSELNEKSLALAKSIREPNDAKQRQPHENKKEKADTDHKRREKSLIIFTNVYGQFEEEFSELVEQAKDIRAICLRETFLSLLDKKTTSFIDFSKKKSTVRFFLIGSEKTENVRYSIKLIETYKNCSNKMFLYILTDSLDSKIMISTAMHTQMNIEVRSIDSVQAMVYSYLYNTDPKNNQLFKKIKELKWGKEEGEHTIDMEAAVEPKSLSVVLTGLGRYGTEFLCAFVWYAQIPGIRLQVHVFDQDPLVEKKFTSLCPELMKMNHKDIDGEAKYDIYFHQTEDGKGVDVETIDFDMELKKLSNIDLVYVTLGDDEKNFRVAAKIRQLTSLFIAGGKPDVEAINPALDSKERKQKQEDLDTEVISWVKEREPAIQTVIFDSDMSQLARGNTNDDTRDNASDNTSDDTRDNANDNTRDNASDNTSDNKSDNTSDRSLCNFKDQTYDINFFGDFNTVWSYDTIINDCLETDAENRHVDWKNIHKSDKDKQKNKTAFYRFEYYRKSSMALAIRAKVRDALYKDLYDRETGDKKDWLEDRLSAAEHAGWNAYMRSEGYRYAAYRYDLANCHQLLVAYNDLPEEEKKKDKDELFLKE